MDNLISEKHYDKNALKGMFYIAGYEHYLKTAADFLKCNERTAATKIHSGRMSHEDTIMLAQGLKMTPRQYINIFMRDVFTLDE